LLDLGCGPLYATAIFAALGYACTGWDDYQDPWYRQGDTFHRLMAFADGEGITIHAGAAGDGVALPFPPGAFDVVTVLDVIEHLHESPRGLLNVAAIAAASERVAALMFGAEDYGRELGLPVKREGEAAELIYARSAFVNGAAAAHVQAVDGVWPDIQDAAGLERDCLQSRRLGFTGKSLIHPGQIDAINRAFSPTPEEIEYSRAVVAAFDAAQAKGEGSIAFGGQLIDLPIVERARRTLALAEAVGVASG
jgi:citrate lyase subunit beta/citryl-CoA lyase